MYYFLVYEQHNKMGGTISNFDTTLKTTDLSYEGRINVTCKFNVFFLNYKRKR